LLHTGVGWVACVAEEQDPGARTYTGSVIAQKKTSLGCTWVSRT